MDTIGVVCEPDHAVFFRVAERLAARGFDVEFLSPTDPIERASIDALDALVNTSVRPDTLAALRYADRVGVETWNGFFPSTALSSRLIALNALDRTGFSVPRLWSGDAEDVDDDARPRRRFRWDETATGRADVIYQERVRTSPIEYRYVVVDDGLETEVSARRVRTSLSVDDLAVEDQELDIAIATRLREFLGQFDARALGVTFVPGEDDVYAVDVDVTPNFVGTDLERRVADSWASLATIGA